MTIRTGVLRPTTLLTRGAAIGVCATGALLVATGSAQAQEFSTNAAAAAPPVLNLQKHDPDMARREAAEAFLQCGPVTFTQNVTQNIVSLNSVSCNSGGLHTDNGYYLAFTIADTGGPFTVCEVVIGVEVSTPGNGVSQPISCLLYEATAAQLTGGTMGPPIGFTDTTVGTLALEFFTIPVVGTTNTGDLVVEIFTPNGQATFDSFFIGSNPDGQSGASYLAAADCGVPLPLDVAALGFPGMHIVMNVVGTPGGGGPTGACCLPTGGCIEVSLAVCDANGGVYAGDDTDCMTTVCPEVGGCCLPSGACVDGVFELDCLDMGGTLWVEGQACVAEAIYDFGACGNQFLDISGTGIVAPLASSSDDAGDIVPLGFTFNFYGDDYTTVGVASNGYLTFGADLSDFSNDPIPDSFDPNCLIAPLWDDWSPNNGGTVQYQTMGTAPNQMFIAQWTDVPQFANTDMNTFQAILFEGSNCIEFRYGPFTPEGFAGDYTVGIENCDGSDGIGFDASTILPGDCIFLCPELIGGIDCPVAGACCYCDGVDVLCAVVLEDECTMLGGVFLGEGTTCDVANELLFEATPGLAIPDGDPAGVTHTITVPDSATILDLDVDLAVTHTWLGDLCVTLEHNGVVVTLVSRMNLAAPCDGTGCCGCGSDNMSIILDDEAGGGPIEDQCAGNLTGSYTPDDPLSAFDGMDVSGDWTLFVNDNFAADPGTLDVWSLHFDIPAGVGPCEGVIECAEYFLDIKPGSCPNSFNRRSNGVLPVALLGTMDFDVTTVDISSLLISRADGVGGSVGPNEGPPGPHTVYEDVGTPFEGELCDCHELMGDGFMDLSMKFKTRDVVEALMLNDLPPGDLVELCVSGMLLDGTPFEACDCVRLVPPGTPPGMLKVGALMPPDVALDPFGYWIDASPLDSVLDGGGFGQYNRTYPLGTQVTLTAEPTYYGARFLGWRIGGQIVSGDLTIDQVVTGGILKVRAVYGLPEFETPNHGKRQNP